MLGKRGASSTRLIVALVIAFVVFVVGWTLMNSQFFANWTKDFSIDTTTQSFGQVIGAPFSWMDALFGGVPTWLSNQVSVTSAVVVVLLIWLMLFVTFGDIFSQFSTFSKPVSWVVGFAIATIAANLKAVVVVLGVGVGIFAFLGGLAILAGLFASIAAFFAINWGIGSLGPWVMKRKAMMDAQKAEVRSIQKASAVKQGIKGLADIGKELAKK